MQRYINSTDRYLDLQHFMCTTTLEGKLHLAPVTKANRVLDVGTGTGIWAIDYADEHPESEVVLAH